LARETYTYSKEELPVRAMVPLTAEMSEFLRQISELCKARKGRYLDRSQIIRSLIRVLMQLEGQVDFEKVGTEEELVKRILKGFSKK
jgi:Arc/MetJ-type ribon-helix-helix transcriptional regulator